MRHAILLICCNPLEEISQLVDCFDEDFDIFIHYDKKIKIIASELELFLTAHPRIRFFSDYKLRWGGMPIVKVELTMLRRIVDTAQYGYIHIISGNDRPIKSMSQIKAFFNRYSGNEFVGCFPLPDYRWEHGTYARFDIYRLNDWFDYRKPFGRRLIDFVNNLQIRLNVHRSVPRQVARLYGGSTWMSITGNCARYIVDNLHIYRPLLRRLKCTFAPDEVFLPSLIMNSPFGEHVVGNDARFIRWRPGEPSPMWLTMNDCFDIATSDRTVFARKFHPKYSARLFKWIKNNILEAKSPVIGEHGEWYSASLGGHEFDSKLAAAIAELLRTLDVHTAADFGCGPGWYVAMMRRMGIAAQGYDANPHTPDISKVFFLNGFHCQQLDLSEEARADNPFEFVMSLEVGEHIPPQFQDTFLDNVAYNSSRYVLLSWAVPGQPGDGHVNMLSNETVIKEMKARGFRYSDAVSISLRKRAGLEWFKDTLMFFER